MTPTQEMIDDELSRIERGPLRIHIASDRWLHVAIAIATARADAHNKALEQAADAILALKIVGEA